MIVRKTLVELDVEEKEKINYLILSCFSNSRLDTYDEIIYYRIDDYIIGFIGLNISIDYAFINQLCVNSNYRNKGIATMLLKYVEDSLSTNLILYVDKNKNNTDNLYNFYLRRGYEEDKINCSLDKNKIEYKMIKIII
jgi:ribosomal protein S18 acetylase RimI-like enzyme